MWGNGVCMPQVGLSVQYECEYAYEGENTFVHSKVKKWTWFYDGLL